MTDANLHPVSTTRKPVKRAGADYTIVLLFALLAVAAYGFAGIVIFIGIFEAVAA